MILHPETHGASRRKPLQELVAGRQRRWSCHASAVMICLLPYSQEGLLSLGLKDLKGPQCTRFVWVPV